VEIGVGISGIEVAAYALGLFCILFACLVVAAVWYARAEEKAKAEAQQKCGELMKTVFDLGEDCAQVRNERDAARRLLSIEEGKVTSMAKLANETIAEKNKEIESLKNTISEHLTGLQAALEKHDEPQE
jgi:ABC-type transport system involved in cytochrome bd biosynthesis fused ATPase/permease subunit